MAHDVFISYSTKDKATADAVCAMLESEGIRCWIAPRDVLPSMEWGEAIIDAIEECRILVLVFTANANASPQIHREVEQGANRNVAILPLRVENVLPAKELEYFIGDVQWLDAMTPPSEAHLKNLAETIKIVLAGNEPAEAIAQSAPTVANDIGRGQIRASGNGFPSSDDGKAVSDEGSPAASPRRNKARIPRAWMLGILAGLAVLILLAFFLRGRAMHWTARNSGTTNDLYSIFGTSDGKHLWAVGRGGTILESDDKGLAWSPRASGTANDLYSIFGTSDGRRLCAVGRGGTILESGDGGAEWTARNSGTTNSLLSIFGNSDGQRLWAVGHEGTILESDDGGETWAPRASGTMNWLHSIFGSSDGRRLWAVGNEGTVLGSDDGGVTWSQRESGTNEWLTSIFGARDGKHLWAVGHNGTILESHDRGTTWTARQSGTEEWLSSIFGTSDGRRLWAVGQNGGILESDDGAARWTTSTSGTASPLFSIFVTSGGKLLWAVGEEGTILESNQ